MKVQYWSSLTKTQEETYKINENTNVHCVIKGTLEIAPSKTHENSHEEKYINQFAGAPGPRL